MLPNTSMNIHTSASALLKTLKAFGASVLMLGVVATSFPITAIAQETPVEPVVESAPAPAPLECDAGFHLNDDGTECVADEPEGEVQGLQTEQVTEEETGTDFETQTFGHNKPKLIIKKVIAEGGDAEYTDFSVTITKDRPYPLSDKSVTKTFDEDGEIEIAVDHTIFSDYTVVENDAEGYTATYQGCENLTFPFFGDKTKTCTVTNTPDEPEVPTVPSITISATKVVCDSEADLPNAGQIGAVDANTAQNWITQSNGKCRAAQGWGFEWAPGTGSNAGGATVGNAGAPYTPFVGVTGANGIVTQTVPVAGVQNNHIDVREILKADYVPFSDGGNTPDVGAKLYCTGDAGGYDNWEYLNGPDAGETFHCVAFNAPKVPTPPETCTIYSNTETLEGADAAVLVPTINSRWTASGFDVLAKWIWGETPMLFNPTGQEVETFTRTFNLDEAATGAVLKIAADNGYEVKLDGNAVCTDMTDGPEGSHNYQQTDTCNLGPITAGVHTLTFKVTNYELAGENFSNNPAGLRYEFTVTGSSCSAVPVPEEPENSCVVGDNEGVPGAAIPFGSTPGGEQTLQQILDAEYATEAPVAATEQDNFQEWDGTGQDVTFTVKNISAASNSGYRHVFGYYLNGGSFTPVFANGSVGAPHAGENVVAFGASETFTVSGVNSIAFGIKAWNGSAYVGEYSTDYVPSEAHAVVYNVDDNEYAIAFEDLPFSTGDEDYNDIVVSMHVDSCANSVACDPQKELIKNGGFETPAIAAADWDIVPSGTSGLEWLVNWINPTGAPATANAELQKNVSGWTAHSGAQYAELDADWTGHTSQTGEAGAVTMSQTITTVPNQEYTFSFWFSPRPDQGMSENKAEALANGVVIGATSAVAGSGDATMNWQKYSFTFTATSTVTTVALRDAAGNPNNSVGTFVDDASLVCKPKAPDTTATLVATKIVCPTEASLPNWGAGNIVQNITATTDEEFLLAHPECSLQNWDFQWATDAAGDPEDNGTVALGSPWATFASGVSIEIPEGINLRIREVLKSGYIPFTGENTTQNVSAEMYCGSDVLHYDNWEHINGTDADDTYYCVAFNAPVDNGPEEGEGTLVIVKETEGGNDTFTFQVDKEYLVDTVVPEVSAGVQVTTTNGSGSATLELDEGWYDVTEIVPEGWDLTNVTCEYEYSEGAEIEDGYSVYIEEGETVTCTFENTKDDGQPGEDTSETIVVTDSDLKGWDLANYDVSNDFDGPVTTTSGTTGSFVFGPETAPLGDGSFEQIVGDGNDATRLRTSAFNGTPLADIVGMSYETYVTANGGAQATYIQLRIDRNNDGTWDDALFFEPVYQNGTYGMLYGQPNVPNQCGGNPNCVSLGEWQSWDTDAGGWWSNLDSAGGPPLTTLAAYAAQYPNAVLANDVQSVRMQAGFGAPVWSNFQGNFDKFVITVQNGLNTHTTTYDFEPEDESIDTPETTDNSGGTSRSGGRRGTSSGNGEVLGAATCAPLLTQYLHINWNNDPAEVTKLQEFLNSHMLSGLPVTGFFGPMTFAAVEAFQTKYGNDILSPWVGIPASGITSVSTPTGFVYQTTRWQINNIWCPGSEAYPDTLI